MSVWTERIADLAGEQPSLVRLAEAVSLAVRVDPPLLRKTRLACVPEADAGTEADLWRSPLVKTRSPDGFVFLPEVAEALRSRLARDSEHLARCRELIEELHQHLPPAVQLEEEIAWLSVVPGPEATGRIEELLRSALAALVVDERRGLASWAARALPSLPSSVRASATASMLHAGAQLRLGHSAEPLRRDGETPEWASWVAPSDLPRVPIAVRLFPDKVELDARSAEGGARLDLPATDPLLVDLSWDGGGVQVTFRKGEVQSVEVPTQEIQLRTLLGEVYDLRRAGTAPRGLRDWIIDFSEERERHRPFFGRERELSELEKMIELGWERGMVLVIEEPMGSGKTAFLSALIDRLERWAGILPPHHFFRRGDARTEDLQAAEQSLAAQITSRVPGVPARLAHAPLADLLAHLAEHRLLSRPLVIVVDAIDQFVASGGESGSFMHLLQMDAVPPGVVVIGSARPTYSGNLEKGWQRFSLGEISEVITEYWHGKAPYLQSEIDSGLIQDALRISGDNFHVADVLFTWLHDHRPAIRSLEGVGEGEEGLFGSILEQGASAIDEKTLETGLGLLAAALEPLPRFGALLELREKEWDFADALSPLLLPRKRRLEPIFALRNDTIRYYLEERLGAERMEEAHRSLAERVAPWPWENARFPDEVRLYGLRHGVEHWLQARDSRSALRLATSPAFLIDQIKRLGTDAAIRSLGILRSEAVHSEDLELKGIEDLIRVLAKQRSFLVKDPDALPSILYAGLQDADLSPDSIRRILQLAPGEPPLRFAEPFPPESLIRAAPIRHQGSVTGCAFVEFARGAQVLSWSTDGTLRLWDQNQGNLRTFTGHTGEVTGCVAVDENRAVSSSRDYTLRIWNLQREVLPRVLWGHEGEVLGVLAVDSRRAVSWSADRTVRIWDLEEGREERALRGHEGAVTACALDVDAGLLVSGSEDTAVRVWDLSSGDLLREFRGHTAPITCLAVLGRDRIVSGSQDRTLRVWSLQGDEAPQILEGHSLGVLGCAVSPDGAILASYSQDGTLRLWSLVPAWDASELGDSISKSFPVRPLASLTGHEGTVLGCTFFSEGDRLVSCSADRTVRIWDVRTSEPLAVLQGHEGPVRAVALDVRRTRSQETMTAQIVSASDDRTLRVWNTQEYRVEAFLDGDESTLLCIPFQDRLRVATVSRMGDLRIHHVGDPSPAWLGSPSIPSGGAVLSPNDQQLILWSKNLIDGQARVEVWDLADRHEPLLFTGPEAPILTCVVAPDGTLLTASLDGALQRWDAKTQSLLTSLTGNVPLSDVQVSPDGRRVLAAYWNGTLWLWDLEAGQVLHVLKGHTNRVLACALSSNGRLAVSASADRTLRVWDLEAGNTVLILTGHTGEVTGCAFVKDNDDDEWILSCSKDGRVGIWDPDFGKPTLTEGHTDWVNAIAVDEGLGIVYSCSEDRTVRAWSLLTGDPRGVVYGVSPFRSLAVVEDGVYAGDEAGNLWKLEYGEVQKLAYEADSTQEEEEPGRWVFLSYPKEDLEMARRLRRELQRFDIEVWIAEERIQAGVNIQGEILRGIDRSLLFVPLISQDSPRQERRFLNLEWSHALERSKRRPNQPFILPVLIGDVDLKALEVAMPFQNLQAIRISAEGEGLEEVVRTIRDLYRRAIGSTPA